MGGEERLLHLVASALKFTTLADAKTYLDWFEKGNGRKLYQEMYDHAAIKVHADIMCLHYKRPGIVIGNQSGEAVAFAMNEAECIGVVARQSGASSQGQRAVNFLFPEIVFRRARFERKHAHGNASVLMMSKTQRFPFEVNNFHPCTIGGCTLQLLNGA